MITEEEPPRRYGNTKYKTLIEAARKRPNHWLRYHVPSPATAGHYITSGKCKLSRPEGAFEAVCRKTDAQGNRAPDDLYWLYVKFLG